MDDNFSNHTTGLESPAAGAFLIAPDDANDLAVKPRCLYVGAAGDISVRMNGTDVTFENVSGFLPIRPERVFAAGTSATNIIGLI